jgi:hypothetical protein
VKRRHAQAQGVVILVREWLVWSVRAVAGSGQPPVFHSCPCDLASFMYGSELLPDKSPVSSQQVGKIAKTCGMRPPCIGP